ncbi:zinc ribbon domain-containing protein [Saccharopolyspora hattusasensis]|uniref:zinc ribbon domain-containing protein n=1 Tax=Saccharopolyspora hattusasensis TaxID=1128679 RepID=UPI003D9976F2
MGGLLVAVVTVSVARTLVITRARPGGLTSPNAPNAESPLKHSAVSASGSRFDATSGPRNPPGRLPGSGDYVAYRARRVGVPVIEVDAHYSSQHCPLCGHTDRANRPAHRSGQQARSGLFLVSSVWSRWTR